MKRIVSVIGGGTGSFNILLGLRSYEDIFVKSIVTMMDSGGDSGRLRDEFGVLPPGDIRRCLVALSEETELLRDLFSFRFLDPPLAGRSFGNLFFLALTKILGSEKAAIDAIGRILKIRGQVIAVTYDHVTLCAELADGTIVTGEANIDVPKHDPSIPIRRVFLSPEAAANPEAVEAITESDYIIIAPGSLYTSSVSNLLVNGIPDAIERSNAKLIYVVNLMTVGGETDGYTVFDHVSQIVKYGNSVPDALLISNEQIPSELVAKYEAQQAYEVRLGDVGELFGMGIKTIKTGEVMSKVSLVRHDPVRVAAALVELFDELG